MLNTKQPKKSNTTIRFSLGNHPPITSQVTGKAVKKHRPLKQKMQKNLSQLPCGILNDWKQNASLANLMVVRPHSSLIASDVSGSLSKSREKVDMNFICNDKLKLKKVTSKRNTLAIDDAQPKMRRASGASQSHKKWNNRSLEEDESVLKFMMAENRKKYNLSCGDMIQSKSKCKQIVQKGKKKSTQTNPKSQVSKPANKKKSDKLQQGQTKKFKPANLAQKSRGSTSFINPNQNVSKIKKKENKENKRKQRSKSKSKSKSKKNSKSSKMFVFLKGDQDDKQIIEQEYPISKYVDMKKKGKKSLNIKVGLDYNFIGLNMISASSGVIGNQQFSSSLDRHQANKLLPGLIDNDQSDQINMQEIKYFEKNSPYKKKEGIKEDKPKKIRGKIQEELEEEYPYLNSAELSFLSSVVLIQRKWRERMLYKHLSQHKQVVTEYFVDDGEKSRQFFKRKSKLSKSQNRNEEKAQIMSRTKLVEFEAQDSFKQTIQKNENDELDQNQYETRKNSMKNQLIIFSKEGSEKSIQVNEEQLQGDLTERKPATETSKVAVNYGWILEREIFPQASYLEYRKNMLKKDLEKSMKLIFQQRHSSKISESQFEKKRSSLISNYQKSFSALKKTKHDIKKGYLQYIDCINKIKEIETDQAHKTDDKYGLRKVSSDSNFLSTLYEKIFKFDKCISEWSGGSDSIEMLTKKILIRKQFFRQEKRSQRRSLSDIRSAARSSFQMIKTSRDAQNHTVIVFEHTDRLINLQNSDEREDLNSGIQNKSEMVRQFKFSNEIFISKEIHSEQKKLEIKAQQREREKIASNVGQSQNIKQLTHSISLLASPEAVLSKIEQEVILQLTKQLQRDIHKINPVLVDIILINQPELSEFEGVQIEDDDDDDLVQKSPAMQNLHRELAQMGSPRNNSEDMEERNYETQPPKILEYLYGLVSFIKKKNWTDQIVFNVNNNQTFQAIAYLRFLRDFEIPDDEYVPIINNQKFIEWETFYNSQMEIKRNEHAEILRQSETIFHRCVFEVFLAELEKNRPYGERGRPFPWQQKYSYLTIREVGKSQLSQIFQKSLQKIEQYLIYRCGLITQKLIITNEEELERAHEQNEDRIIEMLEQDLMETGHKWYQVQEHSLEIKLQVTEMVEDYILNQLVDLLAMLSH